MTTFLIRVILYILSLLDRNDEKSTEKLIKSFDVEGINVETDYGFSSMTQIHKTRPFEIYTLKTRGGLVLECADNHIVFKPGHEEVFVKDLHPGDVIMTEYGDDIVETVTHIETKVCMCDVTVDNPTHSYYTNHILSHNTTTSAIFMLWFILFNVDKNSLVLGNKRKTAVEILDKTKKIFEALPYFLKPGIYKWNESEIVLDNGCRCMAEATTINSGISFTFHCVLADEFAHIAPNIKESFYNNLFPVITAGRARFLITSTQNGADLFCQLYTAAVNGDNEYKPFKVDWWQVPEWDEESRSFIPRDEEWHRMQVGNLGSEEAFQKQFGTGFTISSEALISSRVLTEHGLHAVKFQRQDMPGVVGSQYFYWKPGYDILNLKHDYIVATVDISEGIRQDYTVVTLNKVLNKTEDGRTLTETVGYFKTNEKDDQECCEILYTFFRTYFTQEHYLISLEYNLYGELWINHFKTFIDRDNPSNFGMDCFIKYYNESMSKYRFGVRMTTKSKAKACKLFKSDYEKGYIINRDVSFNSELRQFGDKNGNGTYAALLGHDDMVMSQIQLELAMESLQFGFLIEKFETTNHTTTENDNVNFFAELKPSFRRNLDNLGGSPYQDLYRQVSDSMYSLSDLIPDDQVERHSAVGGTIYDF